MINTGVQAWKDLRPSHCCLQKTAIIVHLSWEKSIGIWEKKTICILKAITKVNAQFGEFILSNLLAVLETVQRLLESNSCGITESLSIQVPHWSTSQLNQHSHGPFVDHPHLVEDPHYHSILVMLQPSPTSNFRIPESIPATLQGTMQTPKLMVNCHKLHEANV